ncbi:MAG TPA: hypothetical protein VGE40_01275 [Bacilli bacterium]
MRDLLFIVLENGIKMISCILIIYGAWLMVSPLIQPVIQERKLRIRMRTGKRWLWLQGRIEDLETDHVIWRHLSKLMESVLKKTHVLSVPNFLMLSAVIGVTSFLFLLSSIHDLFFSLGIAVFFASVPYIFIRMKLNKIRVETSLELLNLIPILLQQYQAERKDVYFALLRVKEGLRQGPMELILSKLLNGMQMNRNKHRLQQKINVFVYSIGGNFAKRLGKLIIKSFLEKTDIQPALAQMEKDTRKAKELMEHQKSQGWDTVMLGFLPLITFPASIVLAKHASGPMNYWHYQLQTSAGVGLFVACIVFSLLGLIISVIMKRPKADL